MNIEHDGKEDIDLIKEYFQSDVRTEHFHNPVIYMLLDFRDEVIEFKLNKDATGLAFNKPFDDINVIYKRSLKEHTVSYTHLTLPTNREV